MKLSQLYCRINTFLPCKQNPSSSFWIPFFFLFAAELKSDSYSLDFSLFFFCSSVVLWILGYVRTRKMRPILCCISIKECFLNFGRNIWNGGSRVVNHSSLIFTPTCFHCDWSVFHKKTQQVVWSLASGKKKKKKTLPSPCAATDAKATICFTRFGCECFHTCNINSSCSPPDNTSCQDTTPACPSVQQQPAAELEQQGIDWYRLRIPNWIRGRW